MVNLLYCGNEKVFDGMMISLLSIIKYTKRPVHCYIMTMDLTDIDERNKPVNDLQVTYLNQMLKQVNQDSFLKKIDITELFRKDMLQSPNLKNSYTPYTLVRLYADLVPELPERILYLDTDTIAKQNIEPVFSIDITDYEFAGVRDYLGKWFININYMNAGILYLNLAKIREKHLFEKARQMCRTKKMCFPDQTALNRLVDKKLFIPRKYNEQRILRKDTVIQHFCKSIRWIPFFHTINIKPWEIERMHEIYGLHDYDDILEDYCQRKQKMDKESIV